MCPKSLQKLSTDDIGKQMYRQICCGFSKQKSKRDISSKQIKNTCKLIGLKTVIVFSKLYMVIQVPILKYTCSYTLWLLGNFCRTCLPQTHLYQ